MVVESRRAIGMSFGKLCRRCLAPGTVHYINIDIRSPCAQSIYELGGGGVLIDVKLNISDL